MERGAGTRRFLLCGHNAGGTVPPMLALAQGLVARGSEVTWLSQPSVRARAVAAGCRFVPFDEAGDYAVDQAIEEQIELTMRVMTGIEIGDQLLRVVEDEHIDSVVVDCNLASGAAAAERVDRPSAVLFHCMYRTFIDVWLGELWPFLAPAVNDARRAFGVAPADSWAEVFAGHHRLISAVPPSFHAPVAVTPDALRHYGFLTPIPSGSPPHAGYPDGDGPTVLVGLSTTYQDQASPLARIVDALAVRSVRGLVTTAGQVDPGDLPAPEHVAVVDHVDHGLVLADTDVLITHAGLGTVAAGLSRGVPLVCIPHSRDQHLNAERVAGVGAGIALAPDVSSAEIGDALDSVLADQQFRGAARAVASESMAAGGVTAVVDDLEAVP
jgi:UDP:flavonoid glycosyltransferase YjiC (YdhE family)